ncbi:MAG: alpha/beta fold hydrolase [Calditrichaeota bacterium]|nr:MAG: alpha/beta fold hydrolase [Calditrichota bacterium]
MKNSFVEVEDIRIYVEQQGHGEPLVMIPGLGAGTWLWSKNVVQLSKHFHLIMPELRGSGRSDKPDHPYSIRQFAEDIKAMLDSLDVYQIHLLGVSMGGLVALYFAATWPERVKKLLLAGTSLGGQCQQGPRGEILCRLIRPRGRTRRERLEDAYTLNFTEEFIASHRQELEQITEWRIQFPQPEFAYYRQLLAGHAFNGTTYAQKIKAPTLLCAGEQDELVLLEDVRQLKNQIPGAQLVVFNGKHLFFYEEHEKFNQLAVEFFGLNNT